MAVRSSKIKIHVFEVFLGAIFFLYISSRVPRQLQQRWQVVRF